MNGLERELEVVLAITQAILSQLDPDAVLQSLVQRVRDLDGVAASAVFDYDEELSLLQVRVSSGLSSGFVRALAIPPGARAVGRAFQSGEVVVVGDYNSDPSFIPYLRLIQREQLQAVLAAPLVARDRLLGILAVFFHRSFAAVEYNTGLIRTLANLAALAMDNARLYQGQVRALKEAEDLNVRLAERGELLSRSLEIHNWLVQTVLATDGLDAATRRLAELAGRTAVVEDRHLNILCVQHPPAVSVPFTHDGAGLGRYASDARVRDLLQRVGGTRRPELLLSVPDIGLDRSRIIAPALNGDRLVGYVSLLESDRHFDQLDFVLCEQGAVAVALEMMKRRAAFEAEQKIRGDFLQSLLAGEIESLDDTGAAVAGGQFNLHTLQRVLIVRLDRPDGEWQGIGRGSERSLVSRQLVQEVERLVVDACPESILVGVKEDLALLLGGERKLPDDAVRKLAQGVVSQLGERVSPDTVSIGIGRLCHHPRELRSSFEEATKALEVAGVLGKRGQVVIQSELGLYSILLRQSNPDELRAFAHGLIGPLEEYDRSHDSDLVQTLSSYLKNNRGPMETGRELSVHHNTVRYRLQKIEDLCGVSLTDTEGLMSMQLALRVLQLTG